MKCIDPKSFYAEISGREYASMSLTQTLNRYLQGRKNCPLVVRLNGRENAEYYQLSWCGFDFVVLQSETRGQIMVPVASIDSIAPFPAEPFAIFRSTERPEPMSILTDGCEPQSASWTTTGDAKVDPIAGNGQFGKPIRFDSNANWNRRWLSTPTLVPSLHEISIVFGGTCSRICLFISGGALECIVRGPIGGALQISSATLGKVSQVAWEVLPGDLKRLTLHWTPVLDVKHRLGVGDDGSAGYLDLYGIGLAPIA